MKKLTPKFIISILNLNTGLPFFFIPRRNWPVVASLSGILPSYFVTIDKTEVDMEKKLIKLTYNYNTTTITSCIVSEDEVAEELIHGIRNNIAIRGVKVVNINKLRILLKDFKLQAGEIKIVENEQNISSCGYTY